MSHKANAIAELTEASHDQRQYLAVATRLVKEEYGDDAEVLELWPTPCRGGPEDCMGGPAGTPQACRSR